jgi:hypothetical protein
MAQKWEYMRLVTTSKNHDDWMDKAGQDGWEAYAGLHIPGAPSNDLVEVYFKRKIK